MKRTVDLKATPATPIPGGYPVMARVDFGEALLGDTDTRTLQDEIEELFADLWRVPRYVGLRRGFRPNVDAFQTCDPDLVTVVIEVPGVDPASLNLAVSERTLVISGERPRQNGDGRVYEQVEIEYGLFSRQIRLPADIDSAGAKARYELGVVTVQLPVAPQTAASGRISIAVGAS
ncbi:MAG: Hsp20 family protein [Actinobacteria bacterium]|uniref:Unannotated protein n=1 Tax=freshwater metagenome TaxID=449393 RepID=A0A6J6NCC2_9ZZZZ|nr:Hsp20 family protein [Actinomycetota bacterium]